MKYLIHDDRKQRKAGNPPILGALTCLKNALSLDKGLQTLELKWFNVLPTSHFSTSSKTPPESM